MFCCFVHPKKKKKGIFKARKQKFGLGRRNALTPYGSISSGCSAPTWVGLDGSMLQRSGVGLARGSQPVAGILETGVPKHIAAEPGVLFAC